MKKYIKIIILSLITTLVILIDEKLLLYEEIKTITTQLGFSIAYIAIFIFYNRYKNIKLSKPKTILSTLITLFIIFGNSYYFMNSWDLIFGSHYLIFYSIIKFIGIYSLTKRIIHIIDSNIENLKIKPSFKKSNHKIINFLIDSFNNHPMIFSICTLFIFWIIYLIAFYPTLLTVDGYIQIEQFFNQSNIYYEWTIPINENIKLTNHHSLIHTLLIGGCIKLGRLILNDNFGLLIYSIIQMFSLILTLSYSICFLKRNKVNTKALLIILLIYALVPIFPFYAISCFKDTFYAIVIMLYAMFLYDIINNKNNKNKLIPLFITGIFIFLLRNNGIPIVIITYLILLIFKKENRVVISIFLVTTITLYIGYANFLLPHYQISKSTTRESLTVPLQQTARYIRDYEYELSRDDIETINNIVDYQIISNAYNPQNADFIKNFCNKWATKEDTNKYYKLWLTSFLKHPTVYVQSIINNSFGYFYPMKSDNVIYYSDPKAHLEDLIDYEYNNLEPLRNILIKYGHGYQDIPILGLIVNIGFNTWIVMYMICDLIEKRKYKDIILLTPIIILILMYITYPVNNYFRYALPVVFLMPTLVSLFLINRKNRVEKGK